MLLPFGLKVAWFCLSLSGLLGCWATMVAFGQALGAYELPLLYCIGCTLLEGSFCLGIIWKMDPFQMSRAFCIAQSTFIGFGTFLVTGVAASASIGTSLTVLKPKTWGDQGKSSLTWRPQYFLLVLVFPVVAFAAQLAVMLSTGWPVQRADDFHCDFTGDLIWIRFLSYAGTPLLLSIPCLYLSVKSIIHIAKVYRHLRRARESDVNIDTVVPRHPKHIYVPDISIPPPSNNPSAHREPLRPTHNSPNLTDQKFHLPFSPPPPSLDDPHADSSASSTATDTPESLVSSSFPTFANPPEGGTTSIDPDGHSITENPSRPMDLTTSTHSLPDPPVQDSLYPWPEDDKSDFEYGKYLEREDGDYRSSTTQQISGSTPVLERNFQRQRPSLAPAIWRLILFQFGFTTIQILSCITSLIAVITHRPPTSFGTQHVALILAGWGPVIVFSHLPAVRKTFLTWLPPKWRST